MIYNNPRIATDRGPTSAFIKKKIGKLNLEGLKKKIQQVIRVWIELFGLNSPQRNHSKAVLQEKLKGVQCFKSVKPRVFSNIRISLSPKGKSKLSGATGHC